MARAAASPPGPRSTSRDTELGPAELGPARREFARLLAAAGRLTPIPETLVLGVFCLEVCQALLLLLFRGYNNQERPAGAAAAAAGAEPVFRDRSLSSGIGSCLPE